MTLKQLKLTNNEEVVCEFVESLQEEGCMIVKKVLRILAADDFDENIRYYSFRPWNSFQDNLDEISVLNLSHIITETVPSQALKKHYVGAWKELAATAEVKRELNFDELMVEGSGMDEDEIMELIDRKLKEKEKGVLVEVDSDSPNIIHFNFNPTDTKH